MPTIVISARHELTHRIFTGKHSSLIFQMRKLKPREIKNLDKGFPARRADALSHFWDHQIFSNSVLLITVPH